MGTTGARFPHHPDAEPEHRAPEGPRHAAPPPAPAPASEPPEETGPNGLPLEWLADAAPADETVGRTGARFNSRARRWRKDRARDTPTGGTPTTGETATTGDTATTADTPAGDTPTTGETPPWEAPAPPSDWAPSAPRTPADAGRPSAAPVEPAPTLGGGVRPYVRTGGRTRARIELALETLVSRPGTPGAPSAADTEHRAIEAICSEPRSVAEVAALLSVPLGVARVLIADMADGGLLVVHPTAGLFGAAGPDLSVVERVLTGLRRL